MDDMIFSLCSGCITMTVKVVVGVAYLELLVFFCCVDQVIQKTQIDKPVNLDIVSYSDST